MVSGSLKPFIFWYQYFKARLRIILPVHRWCREAVLTSASMAPDPLFMDVVLMKAIWQPAQRGNGTIRFPICLSVAGYIRLRTRGLHGILLLL